jgi:hypothetical protein
MGGLIRNSWLTKGSIWVVIRTLGESRKRLREAYFMRDADQCRHALHSQYDLRAENFILGKGALLVACSLALDIEYDTQLHFSIVKD